MDDSLPFERDYREDSEWLIWTICHASKIDIMQRARKV